MLRATRAIAPMLRFSPCIQGALYGNSWKSTTDLVNMRRQHSTNAGPPSDTKHIWSKEWDRLSFGATPPWKHTDHAMTKVLFVETGLGCDQHGDRQAEGATKAAVRACRNAIEFNSIPCIWEIVPGGRPNMKIKIKLGVPPEFIGKVDLGAVCAVFPYGKILPIDIVPGGLAFACHRVVTELGDADDTSVIAVAAITVGY